MVEIEELLYKHLTHRTTGEEDGRIYAWLERSEENRRTFFEVAAVWSAHRTLSSKTLGQRCDKMVRRLNARIDADARERTDTPHRRPAWRGRIYAAAAMAAVVAIAVAAVWFAGMRTPDAGSFSTYANGTGEVASLHLGDGTQVWLRPGTELRYAVDGDAGRTVRMRGEAYFDVHPDAARPFVVETPDLTVRVLGTAFNVRAVGGDPLTEVVLERGSVRLETPEGAPLVRLRPDQRAVFDAAQDGIEVEAINASLFVTGRYDLVSMKHASIAEIVAGIEKNYGVRLRIEAPDDSKRYDINYLRSNSLEEVIDIVEFMTGQHCEVIRGE